MWKLKKKIQFYHFYHFSYIIIKHILRLLKKLEFFQAGSQITGIEFRQWGHPLCPPPGQGVRRRRVLLSPGLRVARRMEVERLVQAVQGIEALHFGRNFGTNEGSSNRPLSHLRTSNYVWTNEFHIVLKIFQTNFIKYRKCVEHKNVINKLIISCKANY